MINYHLTASIMVVGYLTGSIFGGFQSGRFGRKKSLMFDSAVFFFGTLFMTFAPNVYFILFGRFIHGHSTASARVSISIYTGEISQPMVRKITGSFAMLCYSISFGSCLVFGKYLFSYGIACLLNCGILLFSKASQGLNFLMFHYS